MSSRRIKPYSGMIYRSRVKSYMEEVAYNQPSDRISSESILIIEAMFKRIVKNVIKTSEILTRKSGRCTCTKKDVEDAISILDLDRFN